MAKEILNIKVFKGRKAGSVVKVTTNLTKNRKRKPTFKHELRKKQCDGKVRHASITAAEESVYNVKHDMDLYSCEFCGGYHFGHQIKKNGRKSM